MTHTIVTSGESFKPALRSGLYNTYWISGKQDKLHDKLAQEIREAVFGGDGLILDGIHDQRNQALEDAACIGSRGKIGDTDLPVELAGPLFTAQRLPTVGRALKFAPSGGMQQAAFAGSGTHATGTAIASCAYGAGHAMTFGFDLAGSLQAHSPWQPILGASLQHVQPAPPATFTPGALWYWSIFAF